LAWLQLAWKYDSDLGELTRACVDFYTFELYAILTECLYIALAFRLKKHKHPD